MDREKGGTHDYAPEIEATLYQFISLRMGEMLQPYSNIYGKEKRFAFRGGMGIQLPLKRFSIPLPGILQLDYAYLPISFCRSRGKRNLNIWGVQFHYSF